MHLASDQPTCLYLPLPTPDSLCGTPYPLHSFLIRHARVASSAYRTVLSVVSSSILLTSHRAYLAFRIFHPTLPRLEREARSDDSQRPTSASKRKNAWREPTAALSWQLALSIYTKEPLERGAGTLLRYSV